MHHGAFFAARDLNSLIENMLTENKAGKVPLKHRPVTHRNRAFNQTLFILDLLNRCPCNENIADLNGARETDLGSAEYDMGVIDSQHGGIIGQAESKSSMHEVTFIGRHNRSGDKLNNGCTFTNVKRLPDKRGINL
jgi:hypothetical protein